LNLKDKVRIAEICFKYKLPEPRFICKTLRSETCSITTKYETLWKSNISDVRTLWESTSHQIERLQTNPECADEEYSGHKDQLPVIDTAPSYQLSFTPVATLPEVLEADNKPRVVVLREEGTNGDREMLAACAAAGIAAWDV